MAVSTIVKCRRAGTLTLFDAGGLGGGNTLEVDYEAGDVSSNAGEKADRVPIRDRGRIVGSCKGDDPVLNISFSVWLRQFTDSVAQVLLNVLDGDGAVAGVWVTANVAHEEWNTNARFAVDGTARGDSNATGVDYADVIWTWEFAEGDPDTINVTGEIMGGATKVQI